MKRPRAFTEFTNIRVLPSGYQVTLTRAGNEFSRHFAGLSESSHRAAIRFRDKVLRELPAKRLNNVPPRVLKALGLSKPVVGVFRTPRRSMYQVSYRDGKRRCVRAFAWGRERNEVEAYAAAIAFRKETLRSVGVRSATGGVTSGRGTSD